MATTFAEACANADQQWRVLFTVEGIGTYADGVWKFCSDLPGYASAGGAYKPWLATWPESVGERADVFGGVPTAGDIEFSVLDGDSASAPDALSARLALESTALASTFAAINAATTSIQVNAVGTLTTGMQVHIGAEAVNITGITDTTLTVTRGACGTTATAHTAGELLFPSLTYLRSREVRMYLVPADAASAAEETLVESYRVDGFAMSPDANAFVFRARSSLRHLARMVPRVLFSWRMLGWFRGNAVAERINISPTQEAAPVPVAHWPSEERWALLDGAELVSYDNNGNYSIGLTRARLGTARANIGPDTSFVQVMVAGDAGVSGEPGSFRYSPGPSPSSDRSSGTWTRTDHPIPILLSILASSYDVNDGLELANRNTTYGAFDALPVGFGLGVPHALIDWASFVRVWQRQPWLRMSNFVHGAKAESFAAMVSREFLRPFGWFLTVRSGLISLVCPRLPSEGDTLTTFDTESLLHDTDGGDYEDGGASGLPRLDVSQDMDAVISSVTYLTRGPRGEDVRTTVVNSDYGTTYGARGYYAHDEGTVTIEMRGARTETIQAQAYKLAQRWLHRFRRPPWRVICETDLVRWTSGVGDLVGMTCTEVLDTATGLRGVTDLPSIILERHVLLDASRHARIRWVLLVFGGPRSGWIAPAGHVASVAGTGPYNATLVANRYTDPIAADGLPVADAAAFGTNDVVQLAAVTGALLASGATAVVTGVAGNVVSVSSDFGGALATNTYLVFASSGSAIADQLDRFAYFADRASHTVGATTRLARRWAEA